MAPGHLREKIYSEQNGSLLLTFLLIHLLSRERFDPVYLNHRTVKNIKFTF